MDVERLRDGWQHALWLLHGDEADPHCLAPVLAPELRGQLQREASLADAGWPGECEQTCRGLVEERDEVG